MPAPHDLDPDAMTDMERRAKRLFQAAYVFETMPWPPEGEEAPEPTFTAQQVIRALANQVLIDRLSRCVQVGVNAKGNAIFFVDPEQSTDAERRWEELQREGIT